MGDELVDRFGTLPWQVQNLLYVTKLKLAAAHANILSVNRDKRHHNPAPQPQRRRRETGPPPPPRRTTSTSGNTQVRIDISATPNGWERSLLETVQRLGQFTDQMTVHLAAVP